MSLYAAADTSSLYFFVVATLQNDGNSATIPNSWALLVARPGGTALPKPATASVNTSFQNFAPYLGQVGDMGIGIKGNGTAAQVQVDGIVYTSATAATAAVLRARLGWLPRARRPA